MATFDTLIKGGMLIDGTRNPRRVADVGIARGRVAEIGRLRTSDAQRVIDASGLHVAPGFVDLHTHYDSQVFWDPYCSTSGWHGVTSVVIGNCGFGFAPVAADARERAMLAMSRNEGVPMACMREGMPWDWVTFPEFMDSLGRTPKAVNVLPFLPLAPLMIWVMGLARAKAGVLPTEEEHAEMRRILEEALDAGAAGFSAQRLGVNSNQRDYDGTPMVTDIMHDETMLQLAEVLSRRNAGIIQYQYFEPRGFGGSVIDCREHIEEVARASGRPVIWNLIQPDAALPETLEWLEAVRRAGLPIYPQAATNLVENIFFNVGVGDTTLDRSEAWRFATVGTPQERISKLSDPQVREAMKQPDELAKLPLGPMSDWIMYRATNPRLSRFDEMKLGDIAAALGVADVVDAFCDLVVEDSLETNFYVELPVMNVDRLRAVIDYPWGIPGISDGGAHTKSISLGCYPTEYLTEFTRERGWITLEEAHWRLSAYPAACAGFEGRGTLTVGAAADVVVYDYDQLAVLGEEVAHDYPGGEWRRVRRARGYRHVIVNGELTVEDDRELGVAPGVLLRGGRAPV